MPPARAAETNLDDDSTGLLRCSSSLKCCGRRSARCSLFGSKSLRKNGCVRGSTQDGGRTTIAGMRGDDRQPAHLFSYVSAESRVPADHPLRAIRLLVDGVLQQMSPDFDGLYAHVGRPSIPPERLLRAQLLQLFYTVPSERLLMEQLDYNILFRWFVGLELDEPIWAVTVYQAAEKGVPTAPIVVLHCRPPEARCAETISRVGTC